MSSLPSPPNAHALKVAYFPKAFFDNMLAENAQWLVRWANDVQVIIDKNTAKAQAKKELIVALRSQYKSAWDNRHSATYSAGDSVCSCTNLMGNVEQVAGSKLKVLWTRDVQNKEGFFFGNAPYSSFNEKKSIWEYNYIELNRYGWVEKSDVAKCPTRIEY